jgi:hypothetical protein
VGNVRGSPVEGLTLEQWIIVKKAVVKMYIKLRDSVKDIDSMLINWVRGYCREMFGSELSVKEAREIVDTALQELTRS